MRKCGFEEATIPEIEEDDQDDDENPGAEEGGGDEDDEDDEDEDSDSLSPEYLKTWYGHFRSLPPTHGLKLCPRAGFQDAFLCWSEEGLLNLLWAGRGKSLALPFIHRWLSKTEADKMVKNEYGKLLHTLFIGDRCQIRHDPHKKQTRYGARSTTMQEREGAGLDQEVLDKYRNETLQFYAQRSALPKEQWSSMQQPALPQAQAASCSKTTRYALSNIMRTDGLQLHLLAFDTKSRRCAPGARTFIKSLHQTFEGKPAAQETESDPGPVFIGLDPGERISAAFCAIDPAQPNSRRNLMVRRTALYEPMLQYRHDQQVLKDMDTFEGGETVHDLEERLRVEGLEGMAKKQEQVRRFVAVSQDLSRWYSSRRNKKAKWNARRAYNRELELAAEGALKLIQDTKRRTVFCLGDGNFHTGIGLASPHQTFKSHLLSKVSPTCRSWLVVCLFITRQVT